MKRVCWAVALCAFAAPAAADPAPRKTSSLSWIRLPGAESCVATQDLARDVEGRLARRVFVSAAEADVSVEGRIEPRKAGGWRAVLLLRDAHGTTLGTREIERPGSSCDIMREPLALVIAVMLDPDATLASPSAAPRATPEAPVTPAQTEAPPPVVIEKQVPVYIEVPSSPIFPQPTWKLDVGAGLAGGMGLLPSPSVGLIADALLEPPGLFPLEVFGTAWVDEAVGQGPTSGTFSLDVIGGAVCPLSLHTAALRAYACTDAEIGLLTGTVAGQPVDREPFLAWALEGRASVHLFGPFAARAGLSLVVPVFRHDFTTTTSTATVEVYRTSPFAAAADVGIGVLFP